MKDLEKVPTLLSEQDYSEKPPTIVDRQMLEDLFAELYQNRVIYHERITILSEVERFEITDDTLDVWHRPIKLLSADPFVFDGMYERWMSVAPLHCGVNFGHKDHPYYYHRTGRLSMPYGTFLLWPHNELVKQVSLMTDEELKIGLRMTLAEPRL